MAVTIRDVAALAGVSPATVSRTCNNNPAISSETRAKVLKAIAELGYKYNAAPAPKHETTSNPINVSGGQRIFGVVLPPTNRENYESLFQTRALRGISNLAMSRNYSCTVISGTDVNELLISTKRLLNNQHIHGFIFLYSLSDDPVISYLREQHIPYVVIGKSHDFSADTTYVDNDNLAAGQTAASYLIGLGHEKIAFFCNDLDLLFCFERHSGYRLAMLQAGLEVSEDYLIHDIKLPLSLDCPLAQLLQSDNPPTALIAVDETMGQSAIQLAYRLGLKLPEQLSIISFNNSILSKISTPQLTTIDINALELGYAAATQLINRMEHPDLPATSTIVPHTLVERDSCQRR